MTDMIVNLDNIKYNLKNIKEKLNKQTNIIAMVKADAYGLGSEKVANFLEENGINFFGVASVKEACHLRNAKIFSDILVTGGFLEEDIEDIVNEDITISISSLKFLDKLNLYAKKKDKIVNVHIKVETGMSRLGFSIDDLKLCINKLLDYDNLCIDGIYTHLSSADSNKAYTLVQLEKFKTAVDILIDLGIDINYIHALNSSGILNFPEFQFNCVRVGDILYGYYPDNSLREKINLKPSVSIISKIVHIAEYEKGTKISYNQTYALSKHSKIAVVQMGYADGLSRILSNKYSVKIKEKKCKIVGNICMDMFMCDVTGIKNVEVGDDVTILDFDDSIYDMAKLSNTINYEIISRISKRVTRKYIKSER